MEQYNNLVKRYNWLNIPELTTGSAKEVKETIADLLHSIKCLEEMLEALEEIEA